MSAEATVQQGDITRKAKKCKSGGVERGTELKEMYGESVISAVIHVDETTPHLHCDFVPLTKREIYRRKDVGDKSTQDAREICEAMQEGCLITKLHVWSRRSLI